MFKPGFILFILIGKVTLPYIWCYANGNDFSGTICKTMEVNHGTPAQTLDPPFSIEPSHYVATQAGEEVTVRFNSGREMAGIMLDARKSENDDPVGNFTVLTGPTQGEFLAISCKNRPRVTLVHKDSSFVQFRQFQVIWVTPSAGTFYFRAAVVENISFYWARVPIPSPDPTTLPPEPSTETPTTEVATQTPTTSVTETSSPTPDTPLVTSPTTFLPTTTEEIAETTTEEATTVTPSVTFSTTKAPLNCSNGGELQYGVCICPDEWTGETCTIENVCEEGKLEDKLDTFTFPRTLSGLSAYSKETCEDGTKNEGVSKATARCLNSTAGQPPKFVLKTLKIMDCGLILDDLLSKIPATEAEAEELASETQMLTSKPETLTSSNISSAATLVNNILTSGKITKDTATSAVTTVSQLLSANSKQYSGLQGDSTVQLTKSIENLLMKPINELSQVVQPKLVIQTTKVDPSKGVQFRALSGASSDFSANRIQVNNDASEMTPSEVPPEVEIFVKFAPDVPRTNPINVGFALYDSAAFFQSSSTKSLQSTSRVISAKIGAKFSGSVELNFRPPNDSDKVLEYFECVFWDYNVDRWSTDGCQNGSQTMSANLSSLRCQCDHTTNFAVLMSFMPIKDPNVVTALNWMGIIGCSMSILGLSVTLAYQILTRKARRNAPTVLLVCVCASMIIYNLTFVVGIDKKDSNGIQPSQHLDFRSGRRDEGPCTVVAVFLQYFLLATFTFNTLYAADLLMMLRMTVTKKRRSGHYTIIYMVLGWGFPAVMVAISLAVSYRVYDPLGYRQEEVCWLAATDEHGFDFTKPMLWGFLVPMSAMLLFNTAVLVYFAFLSFSQPIVNSSKNAALKKKLLSNFSLGVVLGLTWVLGYLVLASTYSQGLYIFLNFAFSLLVSTQGVQIFILFTARSTLFRKTTSRAVKSISEISIHRSGYSMKSNSSVTTDPDANGESEDSYGIYTIRTESSV